MNTDERIKALEDKVFDILEQIVLQEKYLKTFSRSASGLSIKRMEKRVTHVENLALHARYIEERLEAHIKNYENRMAVDKLENMENISVQCSTAIAEARAFFEQIKRYEDKFNSNDGDKEYIRRKYIDLEKRVKCLEETK